MSNTGKRVWIVVSVAALTSVGAIFADRLLRDGAGPQVAARPGGLLPLPGAAFASQPGVTTLSDVAGRVVSSVVNISAERLTRAPDVEQLPFFSDPFFRRFFGDGMPPLLPREREQSLGSGVIVSPDGVVLTNSHVVADAEEIEVTLADGRAFPATIAGLDRKSDLAVLKLRGRAAGLEALRFGDSGRLRLGDVVLALGNPFGVGQTVTMGIVSATGRADMGIVDYEDFIQTDAAINPGNSGGALVDMEGKLIGINTAIVTRTGGYQGIGFAIPSNMAYPIMTSLLATGKVVRGYLGTVIQEIDADLARALRLDSTAGVLVSDVQAGSPAEKAALARGDVILSVDGQSVTSAGQLRNIIASKGVDAVVQLEVRREGERRQVSVELSELKDVEAAPAPPAKDSRTGGALEGLSLAPLDRQLRRQLEVPAHITAGVVVIQIAAGSRAIDSGLRPGDVILEVNRKPVARPADVQAALTKDAPALLLVLRQGTTVFMTLAAP